MLFPIDLPGCTSFAPEIEHSLPGPSTRLRTFAHRPRCLALSLLSVMLAGTILLPARETTTAPSMAAAYALSGTIGAFVGDRPIADTAAMADADAIEGTLTFGGPVAAPAAAPLLATTTSGNVNLRGGPSTRHTVIAKLPKATKLEVIGQQDDWYRVATVKGTVGWISDDFLKVDANRTAAPAEAVPATATMPTRAVIASVSLGRTNLRKGPGARYASYGKLAKGARVEVLNQSGSWYQVRSPRGTVGWIARDLLTIGSQAAPAATNAVPAAAQAPATSVAPPETPVTPARQNAGGAAGATTSRLALRYVGARYVWGGASPRGFDCSGLTQYVYRQVGVTLPHKASLQFSTRYGQRVSSLGALAPGDLVFFVRTTPARGITHVGLYVGNGMMVTANTPRVGVQKVNVNGKYWRTRFAGGIRPSR